MHRSAGTALALLLGASGCEYDHTDACIHGEGEYALCREVVVSCGWAEDAEEEGGAWGCEDDGLVDPGACTEYVEVTSCPDEGFPYFCEGNGLYYRLPCEGIEDAATSAVRGGNRPAGAEPSRRS